MDIVDEIIEIEENIEKNVLILWSRYHDPRAIGTSQEFILILYKWKCILIELTEGQLSFSKKSSVYSYAFDFISKIPDYDTNLDKLLNYISNLNNKEYGVNTEQPLEKNEYISVGLFNYDSRIDFLSKGYYDPSIEEYLFDYIHNRLIICKSEKVYNYILSLLPSELDEFFKKNFSYSLNDEKNRIIELISDDPDQFEDLEESWKNDKDIALKAVSQRHYLYTDLCEELKKDKDIAMAVVGVLTLNALESFKNDKEIVLISVMGDGNELKYADKSLKKDRTIVMAAVSNNGLALEYADESLKTDKKVVITAISQNVLALQFADDSLRNDPDILKAAGKK